MKRLHQVKAGGPKLYWSVMCALTRKSGSFTILDVAALCRGATFNTVERYIHSCKIHGHLNQVGHRPPSKPTGRPFKLFAVKVTSAVVAPFEKNVSDRKHGAAQQQMWTAMRALPTFSTRDIALQASTDDVAVSQIAARVYCWRLKQAGYLQELGRSGRWAMMRIAPGKNTGPIPPAVTSENEVIERNVRPRRKAVAP